MPALAAVIQPEPGQAHEAVQRMLAIVPHRGEERSVVSCGTAAVGVCHRGGTPSASSPAYGDVATDGELAVAVAGRIDNLHEISPGAADRRPAETLLDVFRADGVAMAQRLRGAYAVAAAERGRLTCFRDHVGFRSLFFRADGRSVVVASEAKQVVEGAGLTPEPDLDVLERIFWSDYDDETGTALRGAQRLPKSTILEADLHHRRRHRYWRPEDLLECSDIRGEELRDRFHHLMDQAARRMVTGADVVSLSGGIDSPAVAAYAAPVHLERSGTRLAALSRVYPEHPTVDEQRYVELVADALDLELHCYDTGEDHLADADAWAQLFDGPRPSWMGHEVLEHYRRAAQLGRPTLLSGELAEFVVEMKRFIGPHLLLHARLGAYARRLRSQRDVDMGVLAIANQAARSLAPGPLMAAAVRLRGHQRGQPIPDFLDPGRIDPAPRALSFPAAQRWRREQLIAFIGPGLTIEADEVCQEACGVQVRRPWSDVDVWELFLSLPAEVKIPEARTKALVRDLLRGRVPDEVLDRRDKTVFNEAVLAGVDYTQLRRWLTRPQSYRMPGVHYERLEQRLDAEDLDIAGYVWAKDLAMVHAFMSRWTDARPRPERLANASRR